MPSYTAWFVVGTGIYYKMTADPRVAEWLPVIRRAINFFRKNVGARGLFVTKGNEINWHPPDVGGGEDADTNSVWVRALQSASTLEKQLGNPRRGRRYARSSRKLARAIRAALFDPAVGALKLNTYDPTGNHTQDANVQGILAGVLRGAAAGSAFNWLRSALGTPYGTATGEFNNDPFMGRYISPFQSGWEVLARMQYYQTGEGLDLIRRLWGHMLRSDPGDTFWEKLATDGSVSPYQGFNPNGSPIVEDARSGLTSLAHGWAAGPTAALSAYVLGMRPVSPGWAKWLVEPQPADLKFAQGAVGTPEGRLGVRWERDAGGIASSGSRSGCRAAPPGLSPCRRSAPAHDRPRRSRGLEGQPRHRRSAGPRQRRLRALLRARAGPSHLRLGEGQIGLPAWGGSTSSISA